MSQFSRATKTTLLATASLVLLTQCRSLSGSKPSEVTSSTARSVQCEQSGSFHGMCKVTEISGRQSTSTEDARKAPVLQLEAIDFRIRIAGAPTVALTRAKDAIDDWSVDQALDLYSRAGCIAEVNGGAFGEGYTPRVTMRALFNTEDEGRTGFVEIADLRSGKPVYGTLGIRCEWQL